MKRCNPGLLVAVAASVIVIGAAIFTGDDFRYHADAKTVSGVVTTDYSFERVLPATVLVEIIDDMGMRLGTGSGVIVSEDGLVLTAKHVASPGTGFRITLNDGREFYASEKILCEHADCAILKIDDLKESLPYADIGNSDLARVGDTVFIIGSPYGKELFNSVTKGIISGVGRSIPYFGEKLMLQADAASNPGNSGGPLVNTRGEVIGILVGSKYGADGLAMCVSGNVCKSLMELANATFELQSLK